MERSGKEQQRQHALHQHIGEIDRAQQGLLVLTQVVSSPRRIQPDEYQRKHQRCHHHADGRGQSDESVIQIGEQSGDYKAGCGDVEHAWRER